MERAREASRRRENRVKLVTCDRIFEAPRDEADGELNRCLS
jgi:hypothetical protein